MLRKPPARAESRRPHTFWFTDAEWTELCEAAALLRDEPSKLGRKATIVGVSVLRALVAMEAPVQMLTQG